MGARELPRREFLGKAAAVGAAGLVGVAGLGVAQASESEPAPGPEVVYDSYSCDGGISSAAPIAPVEPPAQWDEEADVVVVGAGGAGLNAALRAAELGASVICIEKVSRPGGSTQHATVWTCIPGNTRLQNEIEFAVPSFPFDAEAATDYFMIQYPDADRDMMRQMVVKGGECIDWMADLGMEWDLDPTMPTQGIIAKGVFDNDMLRPLKAKPMTDFAYEKGMELGAVYEFDTICEALVYDGERVVGIKANDIYGENEHYIKANKAVFLGAGGFGCNRSMLREYAPMAYRGCVSTFTMPGETGECIRMCQGLGADMDGYGSFVSFDGGLPDYEYGTGPWQHYFYAGDNLVSRQPWMLIDAAGKRIPFITVFTDLSMTASRAIHQQPVMLMKQIGMRGYEIFDSHYEEYIYKLNQSDVVASKVFDPDMPGVADLPEFFQPHDWRESFNDAVARGVIKKADTLEELAELLGLEPQAVVDAVSHWNEACEAGVDNEQDYPPEWLNPILDPPFYGLMEGGQIMSTNAGVRVNINMQVITTKGQVIPGLYAGFHTAGGNMGNNFWLEASVQGEVGSSFMSGYIAGSHIMGKE